MDHHGWTLDGYVLPRLATGQIHPIPTRPADHALEDGLNQFDEGYRSVTDDSDDPVEGRQDCIDFVLANYDTLTSLQHRHMFRHGQDFYLTRNRHGTGFWDRGYGPTGDDLTEAAKVYGPTAGHPA